LALTANIETSVETILDTYMGPFVKRSGEKFYKIGSWLNHLKSLWGTSKPSASKETEASDNGLVIIKYLGSIQNTSFS